MRALVVLAAVFALSLSVQAYHGVDMALEVAHSARAVGLGGAMLAVADDEWAVLYNPAGLAGLTRWGLTATHAQQFGDVSVTAVGAGGPWLGGMLSVVDSGPIGDNLRYMSVGGALSVGIPLWEGASVGARARAVRAVAPGEEMGWSIDLGVLWRGRVTVGLLAEALWSRNVAANGGYSAPWPRGITAGAALELPLRGPFAGRLTASVEGLGENPFTIRAGGELWMQDLALRAGVGPAGVAFGMSARLSSLQFDWAVQPHQVLGTAYRGTLTVRF